MQRLQTSTARILQVGKTKDYNNYNPMHVCGIIDNYYQLFHKRALDTSF